MEGRGEETEKGRELEERGWDETFLLSPRSTNPVPGNYGS